MDTSQRPLGALEDWTPGINLLKIIANWVPTEQPDINREQRRNKRENEKKKLSGKKGKTGTGLKEENDNWQSRMVQRFEETRNYDHCVDHY